MSEIESEPIAGVDYNPVSVESNLDRRVESKILILSEITPTWGVMKGFVCMVVWTNIRHRTNDIVSLVTDEVALEGPSYW